jgi:signal peptidase II
MMSQKSRWFWSMFLVWLVVDQITKFWVYNNLEYRIDEMVVIPGFLSIVHAQNPGAAFGILTDFEYRHWVFLLFTLGAVGVIVDLYRRLSSDARLLGSALGLIMSGAVGNAIDRAHKRTVTDFVRVFTDDGSIVEWMQGMPVLSGFCSAVSVSCEWPSFNVADAALLIGVTLFFFQQTGFDEPEAESPDGDVADRGDATVDATSSGEGV